MRYWKVYGTVIGVEDAFTIEERETPREPDPFLPDLRYEEISEEEYKKLHDLMYGSPSILGNTEEFNDAD